LNDTVFTEREDSKRIGIHAFTKRRRLTDRSGRLVSRRSRAARLAGDPARGQPLLSGASRPSQKGQTYWTDRALPKPVISSATDINALWSCADGREGLYGLLVSSLIALRRIDEGTC
jgi:hypothetical protein